MREKIKKNDFYLFLCTAFAALFLFLWQRGAAEEGAMAVVLRNGETVASYPLDADERIVLAGYKGGENVLVVRDGEACMEEADCPDGLCVKQGPVSKNGESIICLPHRLAVQIVGGETGETDILAR